MRWTDALPTGGDTFPTAEGTGAYCGCCVMPMISFSEKGRTSKPCQEAAEEAAPAGPIVPLLSVSLCGQQR